MKRALLWCYYDGSVRHWEVDAGVDPPSTAPGKLSGWLMAGWSIQPGGPGNTHNDTTVVLLGRESAASDTRLRWEHAAAVSIRDHRRECPTCAAGERCERRESLNEVHDLAVTAASAS